VIDVGANVGLYALGLRRWGFHGRIISFEPQGKAFAQLQANAKKDGNWRALNIGLGDKEGNLELNVSSNSVSSSLLKPLSDDLQRDAGIDSVAVESVRVSTLDSWCDEERLEDEIIYLKLDVQGYELAVLRGAMQLLHRCKGVQVEMALAPCYEGQPMVADSISALYQDGFRLAKIQEGFRDNRNGYLVEIDGIFVPR
jgi:FkbM family methyltransferase